MHIRNATGHWREFSWMLKGSQYLFHCYSNEYLRNLNSNIEMMSSSLI